MRIHVLAVCTLVLAGCGRDLDNGFLGAVRGGDVAAVRRYVREGADLNMSAGVNGWTPLLHAIHTGQGGVVKELIAAGADVNLAPRGEYTPLLMAAGYGYESMVRDLLTAGANPRYRMKDGTSALDLAVVGVPDIDRFTIGSCQTGTVRALLEAAPDVRFRPAGLDRIAYLLKRPGCRPVAALLAQR